MHTLWPLMSGVVLLVSTPGPSTLMAARLGASGQKPAVLRLIAGIIAGIGVSCLTVAVVSWLVGASDAAITVLRQAAGFCLVVIGVRLLYRSRKHGADALPTGRVFQTGLWVSAFNPKPALFYIAFLPSLAANGQASPAVYVLQIVLIATAHFLLAALSLSAYAWMGRRVINRMTPRVSYRLDIAIAIIFVLFGLGMLFQ